MLTCGCRKSQNIEIGSQPGHQVWWRAVAPEVLFGASGGTQQRRGWIPPAAARRPQLPRAIQLPSRHEGKNRRPDTAERHTKSGLVARGTPPPRAQDISQPIVCITDPTEGCVRECDATLKYICNANLATVTEVRFDWRAAERTSKRTTCRRASKNVLHAMFTAVPRLRFAEKKTEKEKLKKKNDYTLTRRVCCPKSTRPS